MEGRIALIAAIVSGLLAVAVVAADLQFGLEAEIQVMEDGKWVSTTGDRLYERPSMGCGGQDFRLHVDNNKLLGSNVPVSASYYSLSGEYVVLLDDTWDLERGAIENRVFSVPDSAFVEPESAEGPKFAQPSIGINVQVGEIYLYHCVVMDEEATA